MSGGGAIEPYSLGAQCVSECIAMAFTIYLGEAIIANELLAKTKGQKMGWGFVALGFGLSFGVVIFMFGFISSHINPATCLALWVMGKISGTHFLALSASEFVGAFIGAVLVWLHYLPHFKTVPEPPAVNKDDLLLRSRDALPEEALSLVSYDTREDRHALRLRDTLNVSRAVRDLKYYFQQGPAGASTDKGSHDRLLELALGPEELKGGPGRENHLRRRSVQVCDVHRRLNTISPQTFQSLMNIEHISSSPRTAEEAQGGFAQQKAMAAADGMGGSNGGGLRRSRSADLEQLEGGKSPPVSPSPATPQAAADGSSQGGRPQPEAEPQAESMQSKLYRAAIVADQNAKLSIFATRPAIYTPVFNFICEFMCTTALIFGAIMMFERNYMIYEPARGQFDATEGFFIGMFVFVVILGLGGPTGIAANPARDFSPRLAHFLLPIPGKGSSEWYYSWVPFFAPFCGGAAAGGLVLLVQKLNHSNVPAVGICPSG